MICATLLYIHYGLFKFSERRLRNAKTVRQYDSAMKDLRKQMRVRMGMGYFVCFTTIMGTAWFITYFSSAYGYTTTISFLTGS
jgi:hypothetical protein